jgi:hypothetical protein
MHYTATLDGMHTGMWLIAGTTIIAVVSASVAWYYVRTAESDTKKFEARVKAFEARVKAFEAACQYLKNVEDMERIVDKLGLMEASKSDVEALVGQKI